MLDLGLRLGLETAGLESRTVAYVEWESYAASQLIALMEAGALDAAPVWCGDLGKFDGKPFRGLVDIIIGGLPCQPYSVAGKRIGNDDARSWGDGGGPIAHAVRIMGEVRPTLAFFENVPAWVTGGHFARFGEELSGLGYTIEKPLFLAAEDVGASHKRERVFVMAYRAGERLSRRRIHEPAGRIDSADASGYGAELADTRRECDQRWGNAGVMAGESNHAKSQTQERQRRGNAASDSFSQVADTQHARPHAAEISSSADARNDGHARRAIATSESTGLCNANGKMEHAANIGHQRCAQPAGSSIGLADGNGELADANGGLPIFAPSPNDPRWAGIIRDHPHLAPALESGVRVLADGATVSVDESRRHQLRAIGNGAVPIAFSLAITTLAREAGLNDFMP
jgi:DNA (cytosine-5)-methyltransferase 1